MECEGVTVPWGSNGGVLTLVLAYSPPRAPGSEADNGFSSRFCDLLAGLGSPAVVLGDLNFSGIDWDRLHASTGAEKNVLETIENYGGKDDSKELVPNWSKADLDQLATNLGKLDWAAELEGSSGQDG